MKRLPRTYAPPFVPTYQFTPEASKESAFAWLVNPRPSIFSGLRSFAVDDSGNASRAVQRFEEETGRSRGTIYGISEASDKAAAEFQDRIAVRKKSRPAGHYRG